MFVHLDLAGALQLFCVVQGLTTAAYLLVARPRSAAARWLGMLLLAMTLQVADYFLSRSGVYFRHRALYFSPLFFSWSFGPLLYAYVRARSGPATPLRWPHWVLGLVQGAFYAVLVGQSLDDKAWFWLNVHKPVTRHVEYYAALASLLAYAACSRRWLRHHPAPASGGLARWLGALGAFCVVAGVEPLVNAAYLPPGAPLFYLSSYGLPAFTFGLVLLGGRRGAAVMPLPTAFTDAEAPTARAAAPGDAPVAAGTAPEIPADPDRLADVVRALEERRLYRDPDLTLEGLARHVGLPASAVSHLLNAGLRRSFSQTINGYRLDEVKRRLLTRDAERLTILALAFEAGFNSKATFNRTFKEETGLTPREYRKRSQSTA